MEGWGTEGERQTWEGHHTSAGSRRDRPEAQIKAEVEVMRRCLEWGIPLIVGLIGLAMIKDAS